MEFLLDTNFLVVPIRFHIDVFREIRKHYAKAEFVVTESVLLELGKLPESNVALRLLKENNAKTVASAAAAGGVDSELLTYAALNGAVVCTNDAEFRARCREKGVKTVFVRKRKLLEASWEW